MDTVSLERRVKHYKKEIQKKESFFRQINSNRFIYLMALPGIVFFFVFAYLPIFGLLIAFQDFNPIKGVLGSKFIGLKNFEFLFSSSDWIKVTFNTVYLNILFIITGTVISIAIAIMLSEIGGKIFTKISQSVVILPHFISWTVVAMFSVSMFSSDNGWINLTLKGLNLQAISFYRDEQVWPAILVMIKLWHDAGFGSIIYLAAIAGIGQEAYQAAKIDGANRVQCIFHITIPMLKNTAVLLLLFGIGRIFYGDFGMIYAIVGDNPLLYPTTDVIDTYVYRALRQLGDMGMASAVGLYQSVVGFILVVASNTFAKRFDPDSAIF